VVLFAEADGGCESGALWDVWGVLSRKQKRETIFSTRGIESLVHGTKKNVEERTQIAE